MTAPLKFARYPAATKYTHVLSSGINHIDVPVLNSFAKLRLTLMQMEKEIGLGEISQAESLVLCAAALIVDGHGRVELASLMEQESLNSMSRSTFFRAMKALGDRGLLVKASQNKVSDYILQP